MAHPFDASIFDDAIFDCGPEPDAADLVILDSRKKSWGPPTTDWRRVKMRRGRTGPRI